MLEFVYIYLYIYIYIYIFLQNHNIDVIISHVCKKIKFNYKISCNLRLQSYLIKKKIAIYFENLIIELHILYALNTYVKFCVNRILFTIWSIKLYFMHNF